MINFFYDSLDTLSTVKRPTNEELLMFVIAVIATLIIASIIFGVLDLLAGNLYTTLYHITTSK